MGSFYKQLGDEAYEALRTSSLFGVQAAAYHMCLRPVMSFFSSHLMSELWSINNAQSFASARQLREHRFGLGHV